MVSFRPRILVTADMTDEALDALRRLGEVEYASFRTAMRLLGGPQLVDALRGVHVFVTEVDLVDASVLAASPDLRVVVACRGEAVNVDVEACAAYGVPVLHAPGRNADAVADLTVAFLLMLARKLPAATAFLRQEGIEAGDLGRMGQAFTTLRGRELWRKTVGLVGFGAVGRAVARRLAGFGCHVVAYDPRLDAEAARAVGVEPLPLDELLGRSDFVSLHAAVTPETTGMIGAAALTKMKPGAFLVNTARAALVDESALVEVLRSGHLAGAALDVFSIEPPGSDHPLLAFDQVIATPHVGGNTVEVGTHQGEIVSADLERLLRGERPLHVLVPEALEGFDWQAPRRAPDAERLSALGKRPGPAVTDLQRDRQAPPPRPRPAPALEEGRATVALSPAVREQMDRLLEAFLGNLQGDATLAGFAAGRDVTLRFTLPDLERSFYLRLRDGAVRTGLGDPDAPADVELRLRTEVLDAMLSGRIDPMHAATSGKLTFRGDSLKAMTLQQAQAELARCWQRARDTVGIPLDLSTLPEPAGPRRTVPPPGAAAEDLRAEVVAVVQELFAAQLVTATGGNVSVRIPGTDTLWITPSQMFKGGLRPEHLVRIDLDGNPLDPEALSPSSERTMHCAIYRARADAGAVIHAHAPYATILVNSGLPFLPISTEAAFFGDIPRVPFIMPGTEELARAVGEASRESWAVLMQNHGLVVAGRSLRRAADMVEIVERSAQVLLGCHAVGRTPPVLPDEVVRLLRSVGDLMA